MNKLSDKWNAKDNADIMLKVREAQIRQLYKQTWSGLAGIMIIMVSVCIALWQVVPHYKLLLWSGTLVLLSIVRAISIAAFQRVEPSGTGINRWARTHTIGTIASGIMWALPSAFLWPGDSVVHQIIWPICIVSLAASAVAKYCIWTPSYLPYLLLTVVPISLRLLAEGGSVYTIIGILGLVFTVVLYQTGKLMHDASLGALVMGIRNETLNSVLTEEKEKEKELNMQLQQEIKEHTRSHEELQQRNRELESLNTQLIITKDNLESANKELEHALSEVKQLSGLLPICASCKKIRDDSGYWQQLESYFHDHSQVEFTHGLCPDCAAKLYPEYYNKK
ncbi:MAG: hypothetical protein V1874_09285 [Spirochaetota bacterium]